jgi:hypothetical protein
MSNINHSNLNAAIKRAEALIQRMHVSIETDSPVGNTTRIAKDVLHTSSDDVQATREIEAALYDAVNWKTEEKWSRKAINKLMEEAIHLSINWGKGSSKSFPERFDEAIEKLKTELSLPLKEWQFYFPILGLTVGDKQRVIGSITLLQGNSKNIGVILQRMAKITDLTANTAKEKKEFKKIQASEVRKFSDIAIASVISFAGDIEAARKNALEKILTVLDILNCFSPFLYEKKFKVKVYLPGELSRDHSINIAFQKDDSSNLQFVRHGPLIDFKLTDLNNQKAKTWGLIRLSEILNKSKPTEIEERLFYATRFAGRAAVSNRLEDSFLFYAIALESLLVGGNEQRDLTLLLSMRTALMLGENLAARQKIQSNVQRLYGIRSAIVHRGSTKLDEKDLVLIQHYTLQVIVSLLTRRVFKRFAKKSELNEWFEKKMLTF